MRFRRPEALQASFRRPDPENRCGSSQRGLDPAEVMKLAGLNEEEADRKPRLSKRKSPDPVHFHSSRAS
jgi:hypothetical protein